MQVFEELEGLERKVRKRSCSGNVPYQEYEDKRWCGVWAAQSTLHICPTLNFGCISKSPHALHFAPIRGLNHLRSWSWAGVDSSRSCFCIHMLSSRIREGPVPRVVAYNTVLFVINRKFPASWFLRYQNRRVQNSTLPLNF